MEKTITIRDATVEDAEKILAIYAYYVTNTAITFEYEVPSLQELRKRMRHTLQFYPYLVAEQNGTVLGYAYAGPFAGRAAYDWSCAWSVYLEQSVRRRGLGRKLYEVMSGALKNMGILNLYACIGYPENEDEYLTRNSANFHARLGFAQVGRFHQCGYKFGRWYDIIWMEIILGEHQLKQGPVRAYKECERKR